MQTSNRELKHLLLMGYYKSPKAFKRIMLCNWITATLILLVWLKFNGGLLPQFLLNYGRTQVLGPGSNLVDHFSQTDGDGSMVVWAHGTNSKDTLVAALENYKVMMIEGEVVLRGQDTAEQELLPVMLSTSGDELTFDDWLSLALSSRKGLKLDFKTIEPVELCMQKLERRRELLKVPVHLGANILSISNSADSKYTPVDAQRFLRLTSQHFPEATIVIGWTHIPNKVQRYDWTTVMNMYKLLSSRVVKQPISVSIHALLSRESIPQIKWLSEMLDATVTVTSSRDDHVNTNDFLFLRNKFPKHLVYYDMHHANIKDKETEQAEQIAADLQKLQNTRFRTDQWKIVDLGYGEKVFMSSEAVVVQIGMLLYGEDPYVFTNEPMIIRGRFTIFDVPTDPELRKDIGLTIALHKPADVNKNSKEGIHCFMGLDGLLKLSTNVESGADNIHRIEERKNEQHSGCYNFEIQELVGNKVTMSVEHALDCSSTSYYETFATSSSSLELDISGIDYKHKQIAISSSNTYGYVAIEIFKIN